MGGLAVRCASRSAEAIEEWPSSKQPSDSISGAVGGGQPYLKEGYSLLTICWPRMTILTFVAQFFFSRARVLCQTTTAGQAGCPRAVKVILPWLWQRGSRRAGRLDQRRHPERAFENLHAFCGGIIHNGLLVLYNPQSAVRFSLTASGDTSSSLARDGQLDALKWLRVRPALQLATSCFRDILQYRLDLLHLF